MLTSKILALFCTAVMATSVLPRGQDVPEGMCCFALHDAESGKTIQQETHTGNLFLDSRHPDGWYCLNLVARENKILWDEFNNACIINWSLAFQCLDPTPGSSQWTLRQSGGQVLIAVDGNTDYKACPASDGGEVVWGAQKASGPGCRDLRLIASPLKGACHEFMAEHG